MSRKKQTEKKRDCLRVQAMVKGKEKSVQKHPGKIKETIVSPLRIHSQDVV